MAPILAKSLLVATTVACRLAAALPQSEPGGAGAGGTRPPSSADPLLVDLGYGVYKGVYNSTSDLNIWKGYVISSSLFIHGQVCNTLDRSCDLSE